jgi:serine phosphatase RsbU (regulator of sigma subunit)
MVVDTDGNLSTLEGPIHAPLGTPGDQPPFQLTERQMAPGERLILVTDGITERHTDTGGRFGLDGIRGAIEGVESATAAACAMAILQAVSDCCRDPLEDDGTVVVLGVA